MLAEHIYGNCAQINIAQDKAWKAMKEALEGFMKWFDDAPNPNHRHPEVRRLMKQAQEVLAQPRGL